MSNLESSTRLICDLLNDAELLTLYTALGLEADPCEVLGYKKASSLFNQADGTRMNPAVREIFNDVVYERLFS